MQGQQVMRRDEVRVDGKPQYPQAVVEIELPEGCVPLRWTALQEFATPDVVDEHVDVSVVVADLLGQSRYLRRIEMVDGHRDSRTTEAGDELSRLLDRLVAVVVGPSGRGAARATGAHNRRAGLAQRGRDAAPGPARCSRNDRDPITKSISVWRPCHQRSLPAPSA